MIGRYRKSQEGSRSRFYFLLSFIFVVVMIKWGFPLFVKIIAGKGGTVLKSVEDIIPPQPPTLSAVLEATNESKLAIDGYTEQNVEIELMVNDTLNTKGVAKVDGSFSFIANLANGANRIQVRAMDAAGNASLSEVKIVNVDKEPIEIIVSSPKDGTEFIGKGSQTIEITGKLSKPNGQVLVNNSFVAVNRDGTFTHRMLLVSGENSLKIDASDKAGNTESKTLKITYTP